MTKNLILLAMMLFAVSCSNENVEEVNNPQTQQDVVPVQVHVSGFSYSVEDMAPTRGVTRATAASYTDVSAIDLAFFRTDGTQVYNQTQLRSVAGENFGTITCDLPVGSYTMVVVARGVGSSDVFSITSPTAAGYTSDKARETFCKSQNVVVNNTTAVNVNVTLNRIIAMLSVVSTDAKIADVAKMRATYSAGSKSFNPATGLATDNNGFTVTTSAGSLDVITMNSYVFLAADTQTMNLTIEALDANDNILFTKQVADVPFQRNKMTKVTGSMFTDSPDAQFTFQLATDWLDEQVVNF